MEDFIFSIRSRIPSRKFTILSTPQTIYFSTIRNPIFFSLSLLRKFLSNCHIIACVVLFFSPFWEGLGAFEICSYPNPRGISSRTKTVSDDNLFYYFLSTLNGIRRETYFRSPNKRVYKSKFNVS